jgi:hypothetical protein
MQFGQLKRRDGSPGITTSALALSTTNARDLLVPFVTTAVTSSTSDFKGNAVRVGLNYKFGSWFAVQVRNQA